jgi:hypothetical protein
MSTPSGYARVYAPNGKMTHLLPPGDRPSVGYPVALCRRPPPLFTSWLGTGSQAEYDHAAALPACPRCERRAAEADRPFPRSPETTGAGARHA